MDRDFDYDYFGFKTLERCASSEIQQPVEEGTCSDLGSDTHLVTKQAE